MDQQMTADAWREDLHFLAEELPKQHVNLFHTMTRASFETAVAELDERIPALARHQVIVELARLVALIGDGHSRLDLSSGPNIGFRRYPLRLYLYSDGLFVQAAALHWVYSEPRDSRPWIVPDIQAELSSEDYRARRDPALEAILQHTPSPADAAAVAFPERLWREIDPLPENEEVARRARYVTTPVFAGAES